MKKAFALPILGLVGWLLSSQSLSVPVADLGGTGVPAINCITGQKWFRTDATAGSNVYLCTSTNVWTLQAGGGAGSLTVQLDGTPIGTRDTVNIVSGAGVTPAVTDPGTKINVQFTADVAVMLTRARWQSGSDIFAAPASASGTAYLAALARTLTAYTNGMTLKFRPDVNCTGTPPTLNVDTLGAKKLFKSDGTTSMTCTAGRDYFIGYNSALDGAAGAFQAADPGT